MDEEKIISKILESPACYDRFTFDYNMRLLLSIDYGHEEAKDFILTHCLLSSLVFQERIHNGFYSQINNFHSKDLLEMKEATIKNEFFKRN